MITVYKGSKTLARQYLGEDKFDLYEEFWKYKVGNYYYCCEGFNKRICKIEYVWVNMADGLTSVIDEFAFVDSDDRRHYIDDCVYTPLSNEKILERWFWWIKSDLKPKGPLISKYVEYAKLLKQKYDLGEQTLTGNGEKIW
jgi:hypothetical protein